MTAMVGDLLEYSRTQLGVTIPVSKSFGDLKLVCEASLVDARSGHPDRVFELSSAGDTISDSDHLPMQQVCTNLLNNAPQFAAKERPITLDIVGESDALRLLVGNGGPPISPKAKKGIFNPLVRCLRTAIPTFGDQLGAGVVRGEGTHRGPWRRTFGHFR